MAHLESEVWLQSALAVARDQRNRSSCGSATCQDCGAIIPKRRQRSLPHTRLCIGCAEAYERRQALGLSGGSAGTSLRD